MDNKEIQYNCSFCKPKNPKTLVVCRGDYISAWVKIFTNEEDVRLGISARGESNAGNSIKINYCPMCGRKLDNEK